MSKKILIVDDEEDIVTTLQALLESKDYQTIIARDGEQALKILEDNIPDLIILDLMMPRVSGLQVCKQLKQDPEKKQIPIIILSAIGQTSDKPEEFWKLGLKSDDFISKPFDPNSLIGRIEYLLRRGQYVSSKKNKENAQSTEAQKFSYETPKETVRSFLEAYNNRNFVVEFQALSSKLMGHYDQDQYVSSRNQVYLNEQKYSPLVSLDRVISEKVQDDKATLVVVKKKVFNTKDHFEKIRFELEKDGDEWKIVNIQPLS